MVGSDTVITWEGISSDDLVKLEYSTDNGKNWKYIDISRSLRYDWKKVPRPASNECKVKVKQIEGKVKDYNLLWTTLPLVEDVKWSPDGSRIVTCGSNLITVLDANTLGTIMILTGHSGVVNSVSYSPDGRYIASGSWDYTIKIWDATTVTLVRTLTGHSDVVRIVSYSPDGRYIASGSYDGTIKIWDATTGNLVHTLTGHIGYVLSVSYSADGRYIASGGWDRTVKVWVVEDFTLQEDESDNVFSIVEPIAKSMDIDMGKVLVSSVKDSVVSSFVQNPGTWKFRVDSIYFRGADASAFSLVSGFPKYEVKPGDTHYGEFRFRPSRVGIHTAEIVIITQSDTLVQTIRGEGVEKKLEVVSDIIDFGIVKVGKVKDTLQVATIKNIGSVPITITKTKHNLPNDKDFTTILGGGSFTLQPGETRLMDLRFAPSDKGRTSGALEFHYNGVGSPAVVLLFGEGEKKNPMIQSAINPFGKLICETFANDTIQISNTGGEDLVIRTINITGANSTEFEINETLPITIPPDSTRAIVVAFRPKTVGDKTAEIVIESNADPDSVMTLQLSGRKEQVSIGATSNIDLGTLCPNESKDFEITISNEGTIRTRVECHPGNDIGITDTIININTGASKQLQCRFTGISQEGNFTRTIRIIDTCGVETNVNVTGKVEMPRVQANDVIISTVLGRRGQGNLIVTNVSGREITITEIRGLQQPFEIVGNPFPLVIKPNESTEITIEYTPTDTAKVNQQVELIGEPCGFVHEVSVTGSSFYATAQLKTIEVSGYAGDEIEVPIILNEAENLTKAGVGTIDVELRFNPTLLAPKGYAVEKIDETTAKIKIENLPANAQKGDVLGRIKCIVGLGNAEACELQLSNAKANGGPADISLVNGKFTLLGICNEGGKRLINPGKVTQLLKIAPNPSDGNVKIELNLVEDGTTILRIYNWQGVAIEERRYTEAGKVEITLNTENYATGLYLVELQTPTIVKRELLIISR